MSDRLPGVPEEATPKLCGWEFNTFTCPKCGGHYFGSTTEQSADKREWIILSRRCNDQFGQGCRWVGQDADCMADEDTLPPEIEEVIAARRSSRSSGSPPTVLPDGSAFCVASFPLPKDHWLYAPEYQPPPMGLRMSPSNPQRQEMVRLVTEATRWAIRGATMKGTETDFDPDALVQNAVVGLLGYFAKDALSNDAWANPTPVPDEAFVVRSPSTPAPSPGEAGAPTEMPWAGPLTYDQMYERARAAGYSQHDADRAARNQPKATTPFPWRIEVKAPDDVSVVCGEFGGTSTRFSRIAECHTIDDAKFIVACCNAWAMRDGPSLAPMPSAALSGEREDSKLAPSEARDTELMNWLAAHDFVVWNTISPTVESKRLLTWMAHEKADLRAAMSAARLHQEETKS